MAAGDLMTTAEAARYLGVSERRVQQMLDTGDLTRVARGLVDRYSVEQYQSEGRNRRRRYWAEQTAWAAISMLSGEQRADWLGQVQSWRMRAALRETTDAADLVARMRGRATTHVYAGHPSVAARLRDDISTSNAALIGLTTHQTEVDGYIHSEDALGRVVRRYALREDASGDYRVRVTGFDRDVVDHLLRTSSVLAGLDAAVASDPRARGVGVRVLDEALARFRG
jgi:excisionase family DNA binding protein